MLSLQYNDSSNIDNNIIAIDACNGIHDDTLLQINKIKDKFCILITVNNKSDAIKYTLIANIVTIIDKNIDMSFYNIYIYYFLVKNNINPRWILCINSNVTNKKWLDDLLSPIICDDIIDNLNDKYDDYAYIGSSHCKSYVNTNVNEINELLKYAKVKHHIKTRINNSKIFDKNIYWNHNIDLKYSIKNDSNVINQYDENKKESSCIYNLIDLVEAKKNIAYVKKNIYWIKFNVVTKYEKLIFYLIDNIKNNIHDKSFEIIFQILAQIDNKCIYVPHYDVELNFDYDVYTSLNEDLHYMTMVEAITHYNKYGKIENRICAMSNDIANNYACKNICYDIDDLYHNFYNSHKINDVENFKIIENNLCDVKIINRMLHRSNIFFKNIKLKKYNVIITFNKYIYGGTKHFLDTILKLYEKKNIYIIIYPTNNDNEYDVHINNNYMNTECFENIKGIINDADSILINSIVGYFDNFVKYIHNKKKIIITHDYSSIIHENNPSFADITRSKKKKFMNDNDIIITQNYANIQLYDIVHNMKNNVIYEMSLPDYVTSDNIIRTNNKKMMILFIGNISGIKGSMIVELLYNKLSHIYDFFIAGDCDANTKCAHQKYGSVREFNIIMKMVKPNIIIFTPLWPETYSYTLTLAINMKLPILCGDIGYCTINNRLKNYDNAHFFNTIEQVEQLVKTKSQNFFYLNDENKILCPKNYDKFFLNEHFIFRKNVVVITSKIECGDIKCSCGVRTVYSHFERYQQTLNTIFSVKKKIPDCFIIFVDTNLSDKYASVIKTIVDVFINTDEHITTVLTNFSNIKIFGELNQMCYVMEFINNFPLKFENFFKLTGRYLLNDDFIFDLFDNNKNLLKKNNNVADRLYHYTLFYKIYYESFEHFCNNFYKFYEYVMTKSLTAFNHIEYENIIPSFVNFDEVKNILGITQFISCEQKSCDI